MGFEDWGREMRLEDRSRNPGKGVTAKRGQQW
jgi:hypothetical protein